MRAARPGVERSVGSGFPEALERVLDKGIVIDRRLVVALAGIDPIRGRAPRLVAATEMHLTHAPRPGHASPPAPAGGHRPMSPAAMARVVRAALQAWNGRDPRGYVSLLDESYVGETHAVPVTLRGRPAARRAMWMKLAVFPDLRFTLDHLLTAGDDALVSWTATGTANRQRARVSGCTVGRLRDGKINHTWCYWDTPDMLAPLRVVRDGSHTLHRLATTS